VSRVRWSLGCLLLVAAVLPARALGDAQMLIGFQDDPSFRWGPDRAQVLTAAAQANATIVRTTVYWSTVAPTRPKNGANPFDPAYKFSDLDELVRNAGLRDMTMLLTVWGTPSWANGGKGQNYAPTRMTDLKNFAQALASRYSGRYPGLPYVGFFSVWNEPNLSQFLAPTFRNGKPVSPSVYAQMARAGYAGFKAGNKLAQVAIGETSPHGRDKPSPSPGKLQDSLSPGTFARLVAQAPGGKVRFDAWAHHPYSDLGAGPTQKVRFPNVALSNLPTFETDLDKWFHRTGVPIWITEYGFQTKPGQPKGVTLARQAAYTTQALTQVVSDQRVKMFVWFIFRDNPTSPWHSGLVNHNNTPKLALTPFTSIAKQNDYRNQTMSVPFGTQYPALSVPVWQLAALDGPGAQLGTTMSIYDAATSKLFTVAQPTSTIDTNGYTDYRLPIRKAECNRTFTIYLKIGDVHGNQLTRTIHLAVKTPLGGC
jgi:hypothetical protein